MAKPKLLIPLTIQFSVRYILRSGLLRMLSETTDPILLLNWHDEGIEYELLQHSIEFHYYPRIAIGKKYARIRKFLEIWHDIKVDSPTTAIDAYRFHLIQNQRFDPYIEVRNSIYKNLAKSDLLVNQAIQHEKELLLQDTNFDEFTSLLKKISPDIILSILPAKQPEEILLRAANQLNIPIIASILSFDNITTHEWMPTNFEKFLVWNEHNVKQLLRIYPNVKKENISIVGSPQFDFYYKPEMFLDKEKWREIYGIPENRPVILFGAGPEVITPIEPYWLYQIDKAITNAKIKNNPLILFRRHPVDSITRWKPVLAQCRNVIADYSWHGYEKEIQKTNITYDDLMKLASTLKYCAIHINASSTMTVDGAILDQPQIGPAYDDQPGRKFDKAMRDLYQWEHFIPITNSGGLDVCYSLTEMIEKINHSFDNPSENQSGRKRIVHEICTFDDGKSTHRVFTSIMNFLTGNGD